MRIFVPLLAAAGVITAPAQAQRPTAAPGPMRLDVAGVRLGMPIVQAEAALSSSYRCRTTRGETTFAQKVEDEVRKRRGGSAGRWGGGLGTASDECRGTNGEHLTIRYAEAPGGAIVDGLSLELPFDRLDRTAMKRGLLAKFGRPTIADRDYAYWCGAGYRCDVSGTFVDGPQFMLNDVTGAVRVEATRGTRARQADAAAVQAEADRVAPRGSKASY